MAKTIKITLCGQDYEVPRISVGQAEDLAEFWEKTDATGTPVDASGAQLRGKALVTYSLGIAAIVLRRATPAIPDIRDLECEFSDLQEAANRVLEFNRFTRSTAEGNGEAGATQTAPAA